LWVSEQKKCRKKFLLAPEVVADYVHSIHPYIKHSKVGRKIYFQVIYPDIAVTRGCVYCHNGHPNSQKKDFALDDVMGGILVSFHVP
jgi:hypothetical protein